jgi:hypothetical protein
MSRTFFDRSVLVASSLVVMGAVAMACGGATDSSVVGDPASKTDGGSTGTGSGSDGGSSSSGEDGGSTSNDDGGSSSGMDSGSTGGAPTWTFIYTTYFGAGTPGHCGNSGCHLNTLKGFKCGSDKATCYSGLSAAGYISTSTPTMSPIADPQQSVLTWFGGNMPPGGGSNAAAKKDITAWVADGAKNN